MEFVWDASYFDKHFEINKNARFLNKPFIKKKNYDILNTIKGVKLCLEK